MVLVAHKYAAAAQPKWRTETRRLLPTRVKRESLGKNEAEPGRLAPVHAA
jgi:hypothetical protein